MFLFGVFVRYFCSVFLFGVFVRCFCSVFLFAVLHHINITFDQKVIGVKYSEVFTMTQCMYVLNLNSGSRPQIG